MYKGLRPGLSSRPKFCISQHSKVGKLCQDQVAINARGIAVLFSSKYDVNKYSYKV
jgi:hypothetical protein